MFFTSTVGSVLAFGSEKIISNMNNIFVFIVITAFLGLITIGIPNVNIENLLFQDYNSVLKTVPVMLVALVFHNIIPVICKKLQYKKKDIRLAVTYGSLIPLLMFLVWNTGEMFPYCVTVCIVFFVSIIVCIFVCVIVCIFVCVIVCLVCIIAPIVARNSSYFYLHFIHVLFIDFFSSCFSVILGISSREDIAAAASGLFDPVQLLRSSNRNFFSYKFSHFQVGRKWWE